MKRVVLTIGPQYAGKSTFSEQVVKAYSEVILASRDKVLMRLFGKVYLDSYSGGHYAAWDELWKEVDGHLQQLSNVTLILDAWNGPPEDRRPIVEKLRAMGVDRVEAWHFVTPLETCIKWMEKREPIKIKNKWSELRRDTRIESYSRIHKAFCAVRIEKEGWFDSVRRINVLEPVPENFWAVSPVGGH